MRCPHAWCAYNNIRSTGGPSPHPYSAGCLLGRVPSDDCAEFADVRQTSIEARSVLAGEAGSPRPSTGVPGAPGSGGCA